MTCVTSAYCLESDIYTLGVSELSITVVGTSYATAFAYFILTTQNGKYKFIKVFLQLVCL